MVGVIGGQATIRRHLLLPLTPLYALHAPISLKKSAPPNQMLLSNIAEKTVVFFFATKTLDLEFRATRQAGNHQWHSRVFLDLIATLCPWQGASAGDSDINKLPTICRILYCASYAANYAPIVLTILWLQAKVAEPKFSVCLDRMKPNTPYDAPLSVHCFHLH